MNKINVHGDWWLVSDPNCWVVKRHAGIDKNGDDMWKNKSYYAKLHTAINGLHKTLLRHSNCSTLPELQETAESLRRTLLEAYDRASCIDRKVI